MDIYEITRGTSPIILGFPHTGTFVPKPIADKLNANGAILADTDWHIHQLYADLLPGASVVRALVHRYVIDVNRDPEGHSLYPGQNTTGLIPLTDFDGQTIWQHVAEPDAAETQARLDTYHRPYHTALAAEIERVKAEHGVAVVFDCHSIRSNIPFLFAGKLPDFNIGTADGTTCDPAIESAAITTAQAAQGYTSVLNGRFKGGWTTRHYGRPQSGVHAIQLELAQDTHLVTEAPPFALDPDKTARLRTPLRLMLERIEAAAHSLARKDTP